MQILSNSPQQQQQQNTMENAFGLRPGAGLLGLHFNRALLGSTSAFLPSSPSPSSIRKMDEEAKDTRTSTPSGSPVPPQQDFKCPLCQENLMTQKEFTQHIRGHNEVKPSPDPNDPTGQAKVYYCCMCRKMLSSFSSLDRHMLVHSGERPFSCEKCGQTFTTNGNMHRHKRTHGSRDSRESDVSSGGSTTNVQQQPNQLPNVAAMNSKQPRGPGRKRKSSTDILPLGSPSDAKSSGGHAKCPLCPESFFSELSLESHVHSAHQGQTIQCDECSHAFPSYTYLKLHKNMYHPSPNFPFRNAFQLAALSMGHQAGLLKEEPPAVAAAATPKKKEEKVLDLSSPVKASPPQVEAPAAMRPSSQFTSIEQLASKTPSEHGTVNTEVSETFADENDHLIRDMKLKGEFPCRLCDAVFPNLRALKGHNKEHMDRPPYICNVGTCQYSSNDKSTLARHMRTHTGEKPFECTICNFGFTTKANCERHVKNKHGKCTREEVRDSIMIHESAEENGGDKHNTSMTESNGSGDTYHESDSPSSPAKKRRHESEFSSDRIFAPYRTSLYRPKVDAADMKELAAKTSHDEAPLDLSRPNTGDSFKENAHQKVAPAAAPGLPCNPLDFTKSLAAMASGQMPFPFLLSHLANASSAGSFDWAAYLMAQQQQQQQQQEALLRRQREVELAAAMTMSATKDPAALLLHLSNLQSFQASAAPHPIMGSRPLATSPEKPLVLAAEEKSDGSDPGDYKMIIKNGVLMKKQKQRRYRTERPHECEHCNARFTLRSNMDRHIKQQHSNSSEKGHNAGEDKERVKMEYEEDEEEYEEDEEEEEGMDLSNLEAFAKTHSSKPFSTFFDTSDEEEEEAAEEEKKVSAYASAPNKIECPFCGRGFPWSSSMKRHILTHTGQKPFKCPECPLWFTTKSNCERHLVRKHGNNNDTNNGLLYNKRRFETRHNESSNEDEEEDVSKVGKMDAESAPFKCYLCEDGHSTKEEALKHLQMAHPEDFESLVAKGAFECGGSNNELSSPHNQADELDSTFEQLRGQFPDYTNRRVICVFCMRKFWSAEDLRRHVRTHTGEKPYECDICHRKFTLKHSMLRHRKKHDSGVSSGGEEDCDTDSEGCHSSTTSSGELGRSSPEDAKNHQAGGGGGNATKKKKPSLMDKINQLSSAATSGSTVS